MNIFYRIVYLISRVGVVAASLSLIYMVGHILYEIILRALFSRSTYVMDEFVGLAVAGCVVWSLGYVVENDALIRVEALTDKFSAPVKRLFLIMSSFTACAVVLFICHFFWLRLARNYSRGTFSGSIAQVPTWIPEAILFAGLAVFALQLLALGLRQITGHPSPAGDIEKPMPLE